MEQEKESEQRLIEELNRMETAKLKNKKTAEDSFVDWSSKTIDTAGRSLGYRITKISKEKLKNIWNWLIN